MKRKFSLFKTICIISYIISLIYIITDISMIIIKPWFTGKYCAWTLNGFILFIIIYIYNVVLFEIIKDWWDEA